MIIREDFDYLVHLLSCAVRDIRPEEKPDGISFGNVLELARKHEVANIAFLSVKKLKNPPDKETLGLWNQEYWKAVKRDVLQAKAREEVLCALHEKGVYTLEVQGTYIKKYYPQSSMRMMSDLDFIVPEGSLDTVDKTVSALGYKTVNLKGVEIDAEKGNIHLEFHTEFFSNRSFVDKAIGKPSDYVTVDGDFNASVSDTVFYLFHLLHTVKHSMQDGIGLRRITDLFYLENAMKDKADFAKIDSVLKTYGFYDAKEKLITVKDHWFYGVEPSCDVSDLEQDIKLAGNHGTVDLFYKHKFDNEKAQGRRFVKLKYFLSVSVFLPKEKLYAYYPNLARRKYPYPVCFFYRLYRIITVKGKIGKMKTVKSWLKNGTKKRKSK